MDQIVDFLMQYGCWGMFLSSLLAGSILPFSSEAVLLGLLAAGLSPAKLLICATVGNVLGAMLSYYIGRLGRIDWMEKYFHVKKSSLDKTLLFMKDKGAWTGFFSFAPFVGDTIPIVLGFLRSAPVYVLISVSLGKALRYLAIIYGWNLFS